MKTIFHFFLLVALGSLGWAADRVRDNQVDDIREATFRWQFNHNASGQQTNAQIYYLEIGQKGGDPSDEFMKRFADHKPPIRKVSQCSADIRKGVRDRKTGEHGLIFRVTSIDWKSDTEVDVQGGYYEGGHSASGNTYTLRKDKGKSLPSHRNWKEKVGSFQRTCHTAGK
jgi:hypothetical protein